MCISETDGQTKDDRSAKSFRAEYNETLGDGKQRNEASVKLPVISEIHVTPTRDARASFVVCCKYKFHAACTILTYYIYAGIDCI